MNTWPVDGLETVELCPVCGGEQNKGSEPLKFTKTQQDYWSAIFEPVYQGKVDTWDYQWFFACWLQGRLSILPNANLIFNIGFGSDATHTTEVGALSNMKTEEMRFPLQHPDGIFASQLLDDRFFKNILYLSLYRRIINKISVYLNRLA